MSHNERPRGFFAGLMDGSIKTFFTPSFIVSVLIMGMVAIISGVSYQFNQSLLQNKLLFLTKTETVLLGAMGFMVVCFLTGFRRYERGTAIIGYATFPFVLTLVMLRSFMLFRLGKGIAFNNDIPVLKMSAGFLTFFDPYIHNPEIVFLIASMGMVVIGLQRLFSALRN